MFPFTTKESFLKYIKSMDHDNPNCPVIKTLDMISGKWELKIIFQLLKYNTLRFGSLKKHIPGITNAVLTNILRKLEQDGLIYRIQFNEIPPHVEYTISESGKELLAIFYELAKWGDANLTSIENDE